MAKTKFKSNFKNAEKKIDEDLNEIDLAIADTTTMLINLAFQDAHDRRILNGVGKKVGNAYQAVPGATLGTTKNPNRKTFHKNKVVTRDGSIYKAFEQITFVKHKLSGLKGKLYSGSNGVAKVEVLKKGKGQIAWIEWTGKIGESLRKLEFGQTTGTTKTFKDGKVRTKVNKRFQRQIASKSLTTTLSRWKKFGQENINKAIARRNKVKIK